VIARVEFDELGSGNATRKKAARERARSSRPMFPETTRRDDSCATDQTAEG
jgi:hypothetical protein